MIGPTPLAFTMLQIKKVIPAIGTTMALAVNRCRLMKECKQARTLRKKIKNEVVHLMNREIYSWE